MNNSPTRGKGQVRAGKNGELYWTYVLIPGLGKESRPVIYHHKAGLEEQASPEGKNIVYSAFIDQLGTNLDLKKDLDRRGVPENSLLRGYIRYLPLQGRSAFAKNMVAGGLESLMARTPGFYVAESINDNGEKSQFWTVAGSPGMVIPVFDINNNVVALSIRPEKTPKDGKYRWMTSGPRGGTKCSPPPIAVPWLFKGDRSLVRVTEGALKAYIATELSGVLTLGMPGVYGKGLIGLLRKLGAKTVRLAFDADSTKNFHVAQALMEWHKRLTAKNKKHSPFVVEMERWDPADGKGIDDLLAAGKQPEVVPAESVGQVIAEIFDSLSEKSAKSSDSGLPPSDGDPPSGDNSDDPEKPKSLRRRDINHNGRQLVNVVGDAAEALAEFNQPRKVYDRGGAMVRIREDFLSGPMIETMSEPAVQYILSQAADWYTEKQTKFGTIIEPDFPPMSVVKSLLSLPKWGGVPYLAGVCSSPTFTSDGRLLVTPGYDEPSGFIYRPAAGLEKLVVPENPTAEEIKAAADLLAEPIEEFPFADDPSRVHAIAAMILPFVREMIDGPTPLHLLEAPTEGTGKTLLAQTLAVPAFGKLVDPIQEVNAPDEWRKTIFSTLLESPGLIFIDNLNQKLDSGPLASALTASRLKQRILGVSRNQTVPIRCMWLATGNNVRMSREMVRRIVQSRLLPESERPYEGRSYKRKLPRWAIENRPRLVVACLTLIRAWIVAGKPEGEKSLGMYERWAATMSGIFNLAGISGFLENMDDFRKVAVDSESEWRAFVAVWWKSHGENKVKSGDLYDLAAANDLLGAVPDRQSSLYGDTKQNRSAKTKFGAAMSRSRDRVYGGYAIKHAGEDTHSKGPFYKLKPTKSVNKPNDGGTNEDILEFVA